MPSEPDTAPQPNASPSIAPVTPAPPTRRTKSRRPDLLAALQSHPSIALAVIVTAVSILVYGVQKARVVRTVTNLQTEHQQTATNLQTELRQKATELGDTQRRMASIAVRPGGQDLQLDVSRIPIARADVRSLLPGYDAVPYAGADGRFFVRLPDLDPEFGNWSMDTISEAERLRQQSRTDRSHSTPRPAKSFMNRLWWLGKQLLWMS